MHSSDEKTVHSLTNTVFNKGDFSAFESFVEMKYDQITLSGQIETKVSL